MSSFLLTIDVEDWFQVENLRPWNPLNSWDRRELRIEASTRRILDLLDEIKQPASPARATFFVLGWIAERLPELVREIDCRGHEVASHGYNHQLCSEQSEEDLVRDLRDSKKLLEDIVGKEVRGYRAPSFSISDRILELIREAGYSYDASYNSFALNRRYGRPDIEAGEKKGIARALGQDFYELPLTNLELAGSFLPFSGGGYFRLLPALVFKAGVARILQKQGTFHFYMHPWEVDPDQPRQHQAPWLSKFRHYKNLSKTLDKLRDLLQGLPDCRLITCGQYLQQSLRGKRGKRN